MDQKRGRCTLLRSIFKLPPLLYADLFVVVACHRRVAAVLDRFLRPNESLLQPAEALKLVPLRELPQTASLSRMPIVLTKDLERPP